MSYVRGTDEILRRKRKSRKDRTLSGSASKKLQNHYVRSVQLDVETWDMADELCEYYGIAYSRLVRRMTRATYNNHMSKQKASLQEQTNVEVEEAGD
jgi:hypothetical protein